MSQAGRPDSADFGEGSLESDFLCGNRISHHRWISVHKLGEVNMVVRVLIEFLPPRCHRNHGIEIVGRPQNPQMKPNSRHPKIWTYVLDLTWVTEQPILMEDQSSARESGVSSGVHHATITKDKREVSKTTSNSQRMLLDGFNLRTLAWYAWEHINSICTLIVVNKSAAVYAHVR